MTLQSNAILLSAMVLATARGETASTVVVDPKNGDIDIDGGASIPTLNISQLTPVEFLQNNSPSLVLASTFPTSELHSAFDAWALEFERGYDSLREHALRKLIWLSNHARIESHNSESHHGHSLGHNDFSDLTNEEFQKRFYLGEHSPGVFKSKGLSDGGILSSTRNLLRSDSMEVAEEDEATVADVPDSKNWADDGAVTKIKNQWFCGACWAFSATGAIEGARYIKTGNLTELSVQQLIDCDMTDLGCGGGLMDQAFQYDQKDSMGLCANDDYPFAYHRHWFFGCTRYRPHCKALPNTKVSKFVDVDKTEEALKAAIATQPVSVAVTAGPFDWQFYSKGVFNKGCDAEIDHGVLAVGYGHYDPATDPHARAGSVAGDYWLIKNSWGENWGLNGYIQLARGVGNEAEGGSSCVLTLASRPLMKLEN